MFKSKPSVIPKILKNLDLNLKKNYWTKELKLWENIKKKYFAKYYSMITCGSE